MARRLHAAQTERKPVAAPAPVLNSDLLRYVARDINHAKANLEPHLFSAAVHLIQNPPAPVAPPLTAASARHWQGVLNASAARVQRARLETVPTAVQPIAASASLETSAAQARAVSRQAVARTQYWHAQIQRFGITSYARHYEDHSDFQTRSAQPPSTGEALHPVLLEALEAHFQQRLPAIQIHSDASAASRAREVGALAFTSGSGIHFGAGQYQPFTSAGFKLLVHETAHVLQQMSGIVPEGIDTDPSLESAAQLEASRVMNAPSLSAAAKPSISSQQPSSLPFETAGQWAAHLLNTLKHHSVPRERFAVVAEIYSSIPVDQQGKARALMLGKLNPNSSEYGRLESALVVTPSVKSGGSSTTQGKPRQPGELNFFTYLNPLERDIVLPNYKAFPVSSDTVKASPMLETVVAPSSRSSRTSARAPRQAFRATHATARAIQRQNAAPPKLLGNINAVGMVLNNDGVKVYEKPNTTGKDKAFTQLPFNDHVLVLKEYAGGWYQIALSVGAKGATGFVNKNFIQIRAGDPGANLQKVTKGQSAIGIAEKYYKQFIKPGEDLRYFVNVLAHVNPKALNQPTTGNWKDVKFNADTTIYIPSPTKALTYRNVVESGSLTGGMVARVGAFMQRIQAVIQSAVNSPQYIGEVLGDLWEVVKANWVSIAAVTAGLITAELVVGALAVIPEPTLLTKVIALLLQGLIVLVCGVGVVTGFIGAIQEGKNWVSTAWTSNGDAKKSKEASKAFLRMMGQIALTALAVMGVRGSFGKFKGLYTKYTAKLPAVKVNQGGLEGRGYQPKPGERTQTQAQYRAQQQQARVQRYNPKTRTDAQLAKDLNPALRPSEMAVQAQARIQAAQAEIEARAFQNAYAGYGAKPPEKFRITDNDARGGGAHTLERHGAQIPLRRTDAPSGQRTIEGRVFGDSPWPNRQNYSLKWLSDSIMDRAVRWALESKWKEIRSSLARGERFEDGFVSPQAVGEGFYNAGTNAAPRAVYMKTSLFRITVLPDQAAPGGFKVITTLPNGSGR